jgi:hypothetical protein
MGKSCSQISCPKQLNGFRRNFTWGGLHRNLQNEFNFGPNQSTIDSPVSIETGLRAGQAGFDSRQRPTQPLIQWVPGAPSPEVKRPGREADHSPPYNAEVKNGWNYTRDSAVALALGYGLDDLGSRVRFPAGPGNFSLHHRVQNGFGAHPASYPLGTRGSFPGGKAAGAWSWPLTSI